MTRSNLGATKFTSVETLQESVECVRPDGRETILAWIRLREWNVVVRCPPDYEISSVSGNGQSDCDRLRTGDWACRLSPGEVTVTYRSLVTRDLADPETFQLRGWSIQRRKSYPVPARLSHRSQMDQVVDELLDDVPSQ